MASAIDDGRCEYMRVRQNFASGRTHSQLSRFSPTLRAQTRSGLDRTAGRRCLQQDRSDGWSAGWACGRQRRRPSEADAAGDGTRGSSPWGGAVSLLVRTGVAPRWLPSSRAGCAPHRPCACAPPRCVASPP